MKDNSIIKTDLFETHYKKVHDKIIEVEVTDSKNVDLDLIKKADFCICCEDMKPLFQKEDISYYIFNNNHIEDMTKKIIEENTEIYYALPFNFPIFRNASLTKAIGDTAMQNGIWVAGTSLGNIVPGPHQVVTAIAEGTSDTVVMTANELKMMIELLAISGKKINPLTCVAQYLIIAGLANLAKLVATSLSGKIPAGAGVPMKAAIAYGFTYTIGQAIYIYINTGEKMGKEFFDKNIKEHSERIRSKMEEMAKDIMKKK